MRTRRNNPKRLRARVRKMLLETLEDRRVMYGPGENNDTLSTAQPVLLYPSIPYTISERISGAEIDPRDVDMFRVELQSGARLTADLDILTSDFGTCVSSLQGGIRLFGPDGREVAASSVESVNGDPVKQFVASSTGVYTIGIASAENNNYAPDTTVGRAANVHTGAYYLKLLMHPQAIDTTSVRRFTVNTHLDVVNPSDQYLSLREAIGAVEASGTRGIVDFSLLDGFRTLEMTQGTLIVSGQVSIVGPSQGTHLVIRPATGSLASGLLHVNVGADVSLSNVTLVDGKAGSGNGGNIRAHGSLKLDSVELIGGTAMLGGGLYAGPGSRVHIERTTISGNQATNGGGTYIDAGARFSAVNSTFSGNTAQNAGAALTSIGNSSLMNVTIVNNGISTGQSTVNATGTVTLRNTLVGANKTQTELVGLIESQGYNSLTQSSFVSSSAPFIDLLDQTPKIGPLAYQGGYAATHTPMPGSLGIDRGGTWGVSSSDQRGAPRILDGYESHAPLDTLAQPDIGAFETGAYFVSTSLDEIDQTPLGDGVADASAQPGLQISLRAAVQELNALTLGNAQTPPQKLEGVIFVDRGLLLNRYGSLEDSALTGDLDVHGRLRVQSLGNTPFQITGGWDPTTPTGIDLRDRIWHVHPGADLTLANVAVGGGYVHSNEAGVTSQGGAIFVDNSKLTLDQVNLLGSQAQQGGAIYARASEVTLLSTVGRNSRADYGGALYLESGKVTLNNSELASNGAFWGGGAIFVQSGDLSLRAKSRLSGNILTGSLVSYAPETDLTRGMGAGILNIGGSITIADESVLSGNFAPAASNTRYGNAIANFGTLQIFGGSSIQQNGVFTSNAFVPPAADGVTVYAHYAIYNKGTARITDSQFVENQSGAIFNSGGELDIERVDFNRNTGNHFGTGILNINGTVSIVDSRFEGNWNPTYAPVIFNHDLGAQTTIINSAFVDNRSENGAGAVLNRHGRVSISGSTFLNNIAINDGEEGFGGAIRNEGIHRFLTTLAGRTGMLDAAINPTQSEIYLQSLSPYRDLPLPFSIMVGNERMAVTGMDELKVSITVSRQNGSRHEVSDVVRMILDEHQDYILLDNPIPIARYKLPLNIVINTEILTITSLEGSIAHVQRGRQGTVAQVHNYPVDVWGAAGGLEITSSSFIGNGLSFPGRSPDWDRGGAIYNVTDALTPPTLIEASFFQGNQAVTGAAIHNELRYPKSVLSSAKLRGPDGKPIWGIVGPTAEVAHLLQSLPNENLEIGSSVFTDNRHPDGRPAAAIDSGERLLTPSNATDAHWKSEPYALVPTQNLKSTGGNLVDADLVSFTFLEEALSPNQTSLAIVLPKNTSLPVPFKARLSHATEQGLVVEDVMVTSLVTIPDPKATREPRAGVVFADETWARISFVRGFDGTQAVTHPAGARFVISLSGFTKPGDRIGTLKEIPFQFETELLDSDGISSTDTTVAVRDASRFPSVPFQIHVTQVNAPGKYEMMTVTAISGNLLTVERGTSYTDPLAHPNGSRIEYEWKTFDRLDVGYLSSIPISRTQYKNEFRADSPVIDRGSSDADPVLTTSISTSLPADYSQEVNVRFALTSVSVPFKGPLFATDVQLKVAPTNGLPPVPFYALLEDEVLHVTSISADGKWTVTRGALGTNAVDHLMPTSLSIGLPIGPDASVLSLENTGNLPEAPFIMEIGNELLRVTSIDQQARSIRVERGVLGTTAIRHEVAVVGGVGRWVEIGVGNPVPNVGTIGVLGNERVRVVTARPANRAVLLERGFDQTTTVNHSPKTSLLFHGSGTLGALASPMLKLNSAIAESTQTIRVLGSIAPQIGTELAIDLEIMRVTRAVRVNSEAWDLTVIRGVRGTSPTSHSSSAAIRLLVDGSFQSRTAAGLSGSNPIVDIGATESDLIIVNTTEDLPDTLIGDGKSITSQGTVSLRAALQEAAATQRRVRIQLPSGTIRVSSELVIDSNVEIVGAGADRTVISAVSSRVFRVPADRNLKLSTLTLIGNAGSANGGALLIEGGRVEFLHSVVRDSRATDGAAIAVSSGTLWLHQSSLINNVGVRGGAISISSGQVEMRGATLSGNRANTGGAIFVSPQAQLSIHNSTIAYNDASQGAAIDNKGSVTSLSSIFANNTSGTSNSKLTGRFVSGGFNLLDVQPDATATTSSFLNAEDVTAQLVITQQLTAPPAVPFDIRVSNSETMTVVAIQGATLSVVRSSDRTLRKQHFPGSPIRTDGFWSKGDQSGTVTAPLDPKLIAIRAGDDGVPVHSLAADSPAVDTSDEALFQGRTLLLATGALPGDTQIVLQSSDGLPPAPFRISIQGRKYLVTRVIDRTLELSANVAGLAPGSSENRAAPFFRQGTAVQLLTDATGASRIVDYPHQSSSGGSSGWGNFYGGGYGSYIPPGSGGSSGPMPSNPSPIYQMDIGAVELVERFAISAARTEVPESTQFSPNNFQFTVTRSGITNRTTTVEYIIRGKGVNGVEPTDFVSGIMPRATLTFAAGETEKTVSLPIAFDDRVEGDEAFEIVLVPTNADVEIPRATLSGLIQDDDLTTLRFNVTSPSEGKSVIVVASTDKIIEGGFSLRWQTSSGTATADLDYRSTSGIITWTDKLAANQAAEIFTTDDQIVERDETIRLLFQPQFASPVTSRITIPTEISASILNNDRTQLTIRNTGTIEGHSGTKTATFELTSSHAVDVPFSVTVAGVAATASLNTDFTAASRVLNFSGEAGQTLTFSSTVVGDTVIENDETYSVRVQSVQAAGRESSIVTNTATGTIWDDDRPKIIVAPSHVTEGASGLSEMVFNVTLVKPHGSTVRVTATTAPSTATAGTDYTHTSSVLTFTGTSVQTLTFSVPIIGDKVVEGEETFLVNLSNLQASTTYTLVNGTGTIRNDDVATLRMVIPDDFKPKPGEDPNRIVVAGSAAGIPALQLELDAAVSGTVTASLNVRWVGQTTTSTPQTIQFSGVAGERFSIPITAPTDYSSSRDLAIQVTDVSASGMAVGGSGNWVVQFDADRSASTGQVCAGPTHRDPYRNTNTQGTGSYLPIPILIKIYSERSPEGYLIGYWATADGFRVPGPGWYLGKLYTANPDEVPDMSLAVPGDIGFGRDRYGYAIIPVMKNGVEYLMGSVDRNLRGTLEDFLRSNPGAERSEDGPGSCETDDSEDEPDPPTPSPQPSDVKADWVIPHNSPFTFSPFPSFNYNRSEKVALTIFESSGRIAKVGDTVKLQFGSITVNADNTLTYTPASDLTTRTENRLKPEADAFGNIFRFTGIDSFEAHLVNPDLLGKTDSDPRARAYASTPIALAVSNTLPTVKGDFLRQSQEADQTDKIFIERNTTLQVDLKSLYSDLDGVLDLSKIRVVDIKYNQEKLDVSTESNPDPHPTQIRIPLATNGLWGLLEVKKSLIVSSTKNAEGGPLLLIQNEVSSDMKSDNFPKLVRLTVQLTDGTEVEVTQTDGTKKYVPFVWNLDLYVVPHVNQTVGLWRNQPSVPVLETTPWIKEVTPNLLDRYDSVQKKTEANKFEVEATVPTLDAAYQYDTIGNASVNLFNGALLRSHELILDGSGGTSEMALGGLIYDSTTLPSTSESPQTNHFVLARFQKSVQNPLSGLKFTLKWFGETEDNTSTVVVDSSRLSQQEFLVALRPQEPPTKTGVYSWHVETEATYGTGENAIKETQIVQGQSPVVVIGPNSNFGAGWSLAGMPTLTLSKGYDLTGEVNNKPLDDRFLLHFPGSAPALFNASSLALTASYEGVLDSIEYGSLGIGATIRQRGEYGSLTSRAQGDEIVYKSGDGTEYVFARDSDTFNLVRIEPPGVEYNALTWDASSVRRGLSFTWENPGNGIPPRLESIVSSDGVETTLTYDALNHVSKISRDLKYQVALTYNTNRLKEIKNLASGSATPTVQTLRHFDYNPQGQLVADQWWDLRPTTPKLDATTSFGYEAGFLREVQVGSAFPGTSFGLAPHKIEPALSTIAMNAKSAAEFYSKSYQQIDDLKKVTTAYPLAVEGASTTYQTQNLYSLEGLLITSTATVNDADALVNTWSYTPQGNIKSSTNTQGQKSYFWYDYQIPFAINSITDPANHTDPALGYDIDDFRGNLIISMTPPGLTYFNYETDDETDAAHSRLVQLTSHPSIQGTPTKKSGGSVRHTDTYFKYGNHGQMTSSQTVRGLEDFFPQQSTPSSLFSFEDQSLIDVIEIFEYDTNGFLKSHTSPNGTETKYRYVDRRLVSRVDTVGTPLETSTTYEYDDNGFVDKETVKDKSDQTVRVVHSNYDCFGRLIDTKVESLTFSLQNRPVSPTTQLSTISYDQFQYDSIGNLLSKKNKEGVVHSFVYNIAGQLVSETEAQGASYPSVYTNGDVSISVNTAYKYYSDGSIKEEVRSGSQNSKLHFYYSPTTGKSWKVLDGVSSGPHLIASDVITLNLNGKAITETTRDKFGRVVDEKDLLTGATTTYAYADPRVALPTTITEKLNLGWDGSGWRSGNQVSKYNYDASGNTLTISESGRRYSIFNYNSLGQVIRKITLGSGTQPAIGAEIEYRYDPSGRLLQEVETRRNPEKDNELLTTAFYYDDKNAIQYFVDPLSGYEKTIESLWKSRANQSETAGSSPPATWIIMGREARTAPTTITSTYDGGLIKTVSKDRTSLSTTQWTNGAGQVVKTLSSLGAETYFEYDSEGRLIVELQKKPDNSGVITTKYKYDQLGRLRSTSVEAGNQRQVTYTDFFSGNDVGADGWHIVQYPVHTVPSSVQSSQQHPTDAKNRGTRTMLDSIGNPVYVQQPDPDYLSDNTIPTTLNNTPTTLITYEYQPNKQLVATTTRSSIAPNSDGNPTIYMAYNAIRVARNVTNSTGQTLLNATRSSYLDHSDIPQTENMVDMGFVVRSQQTYDELGNLRTSAAPLGNDDNANARMQTISFEYDDLGRVIEERTPGGAFTKYKFDSSNNLIRLEDNLGLYSAYSYDKLNRPLTNRSPKTPPTSDAHEEVMASWEYAGNTTKYTNRNGWVTTSAFTPATIPSASGPTNIYSPARVHETSIASGGGSKKYERSMKLRSDGAFLSGKATWDIEGSQLDSSQSTVDQFFDEFGRENGSSMQLTFEGVSSPRFIVQNESLPNGFDRNRKISIAENPPSSPTPIISEILSEDLIYDGLGRVVSQKMKFNQAQKDKWEGAYTPRDLKVENVYNADSLLSSARYEKNGTLYSHPLMASYGYLPDGTMKSVEYDYVSEFTATITNQYHSNGLLKNITRRIDTFPLLATDVTSLAYDDQNRLLSQTRILPASSITPTRTISHLVAPERTPGDRPKQDDQFSFKYDNEGNLLERTSRVPVQYIDDADSARVVRSDSDSFQTEVGTYQNNQQGSSSSYAGAVVTFNEVPAGIYDLWATWKPKANGGDGTYKLSVSDVFTKNGSQNYFKHLTRDPQNGFLRRSPEFQLPEEVINVNFATSPGIDVHSDGMAWFPIGTLHLDDESILRLKADSRSGILLDAFKLVPHITKEIFKYDHANRLIQTETFTHQSATPLVTSQLYDALGRVILTNTEVVGKFNVSSGTVYQGNKPVLQFDMTEGYSSFYIQSFKWMDERGEVIASQATTTNDAAKPGPQEHAATWHLNHLDGSHFVDTKNWHDGNSEFWLSGEFPFAPNQRSHVGPDEFTHGTSSARSWHQSRSDLMKESRFSYYAQFADPAHEVLNYVGIVDPFGVADGLNAVWYAAEGFAGRPGAFANASISAIGALVPYAGDLLKFGKAGKAAAESCGLITKVPTKQLAIRAGQSAVAGAAAGAVIGGTVSHVAGGDPWHGATHGAIHGALGGFSRGFFLNRYAQACFTAGTPLVVDLEGNSKPIEQIQVGEMVLARNEFEPHGPLELKRVEELFTRTSPIIELEIGGQKIGTTEEHPFYVPAREAFVPARELQVGDQLVSHDGQLLRIDAIHSTLQIATVYNLRVADYHTYFVGCDEWGWSVWAHNAGCTPEQATQRIGLLRNLLFDDNIPKSASHRANIHSEIQYLETFTQGNFVQAQHVQTVRGGTVTRTVFKNTEHFDGGVPQFIDRRKGLVQAEVLDLLDNHGYTNKMLMEKGYAPIGRDGRPINLHHLDGIEPGRMIELQASVHERYQGRLHDMITDGSGVQGNAKTKSAYRRFAKQYWVSRADDF